MASRHIGAAHAQKLRRVLRESVLALFTIFLRQERLIIFSRDKITLLSKMQLINDCPLSTLHDL